MVKKRYKKSKPLYKNYIAFGKSKNPKYSVLTKKPMRLGQKTEFGKLGKVVKRTKIKNPTRVERLGTQD